MSIYIIAFHHPERAHESLCRSLMNEYLCSQGHTVWELERGAYLKDKDETAVKALLEFIAAKVKDNSQDVVLVMDANFGYSDANAMVAFQVAELLKEGFLGFPFHYSEEEKGEKPVYGSIKLLLTGGGGTKTIKCKSFDVEGFDVEGKSKKYTFNVELGDFALRKQKRALNDLIRPFKAEEKKKRAEQVDQAMSESTTEKKVQQIGQAINEPTELLSVKTPLVLTAENRSSISRNTASTTDDRTTTVVVMESIGSPMSKKGPSTLGVTMDTRDNSGTPTTQTRSPPSERTPRIFAPTKVAPISGDYRVENPDNKEDSPDEHTAVTRVGNFLKKEEKPEKKPGPGSNSGCCSIQ